MQVYDGMTFTRGGRRFKLNLPYDHDHDAPWDECDGHGEVRDASVRDADRGELELSNDRGYKRFYDFIASMKIAKRDGWGCGDMTDDDMREASTILQAFADADAQLVAEDHIDEADAYVFDPADIEQIKLAVAVNRDYKHLRGWCNDEWTFICVDVTLLDEDGDDDAAVETESLSGVESDEEDYIGTLALEHADTINARLDKRLVAEIDASRPDMQVENWDYDHTRPAEYSAAVEHDHE